MKYILTLTIVLLASIAQAQDVSTAELTWKINQGKDLRTNAQFTYQGTLTTQGSSTIVWSQRGGESSFRIVGIDGLWPDLGKVGKVSYQVEQDGATGTIFFERTSNGLFAQMEFPKNDANGSKVRFTVSSVSKAN